MPPKHSPSVTDSRPSKKVCKESHGVSSFSLRKPRAGGTPRTMVVRGVGPGGAVKTTYVKTAQSISSASQRNALKAPSTSPRPYAFGVKAFKPHLAPSAASSPSTAFIGIHAPEPGGSSTFSCAFDPELEADFGCSGSNTTPALPLEEDTVVSPKQNKKMCLSSTRFPILGWLPLRWEYLLEVFRLDGRGGTPEDARCKSCADGDAEFRCNECFSPDLVCKGCILERHTQSPFHRVERWNGEFFEKVSLGELGMRIQLMHEPSFSCLRAITVKDFVVIHTNGFHRFELDFCDCSRRDDAGMRQQLLRWRLWPATVEKPATAATFEVLDLLHKLSTLANLTTHGFCKTLEALTDASGISNIPDRSHEIRIIMREWRHVHMIKRSGCGHLDSIANADDGAFAVRCPACPREGAMPLESESTQYPFLGRIFLAIDANFRLKNRLNRTTEESDPPLNDGRAYVVASPDYDAYTTDPNVVKQTEASTCSRFGALALANLKTGKGLRSTGIAGIFCARHEFWLPNGLGLLKKGERYCNIDYVFTSVMRWITTPWVVISYDIACQWHKNLLARLKAIPKRYKIFGGAQKFLGRVSKHVKFVLPKFHLPAHKEDCQNKFNFNLTSGVGETDGEAPERMWAASNQIASSAKEMGPNTMRDTVDDLCASWNFLKVIGIGKLLARRAVSALEKGPEHAQILTFFTRKIEHDSPDALSRWRADVEEWERTSLVTSKPSPYSKSKQDLTLDKLRLKAAEEKRIALTQSSQGLQRDEAFYADFLVEALRLEADEMRLDTVVKNLGGTTLQAAGKAEAKNAILLRVEKHREGHEQYLSTVTRELVRTGLLKPLNIKRPTRARAVKSAGPLLTQDSGADTADPSDDSEANDTDTDDDSSDSDGESDVGDVAGSKAGSSTVEGNSRQAKPKPKKNESTTCLWLPSDLNPRLRALAPKPVVDFEKTLREAGMSDALDNLREQLRLRSALNRFKVDNVTGQRANTRAWTVQTTVDIQVKLMARTYRRHREAYKSLVGAGQWEETYRVLLDEHCRSLGDRVLEKADQATLSRLKSLLGMGPSDSSALAKSVPKKSTSASGDSDFHLPWIWYSGGSSLDTTDDLKVEWMKCRARAQRWMEEVRLLREEMRRVSLSFEQQVVDWNARRDKWSDDSSPFGAGRCAYAAKQATMYRALGCKVADDFRKHALAMEVYLSSHTDDGMFIDLSDDGIGDLDVDVSTAYLSASFVPPCADPKQ